MQYGPFELEISTEATHVDYAHLPEEIQKALCCDVTYDPATHDVFSFSVAPKELLGYSDVRTRQEKKRSYCKVDRVLIQAVPASDSICFIGIYPTTTAISGQRSLDIKGDVLFEVSVPKLVKLQVKSEIKNRIRSDVYEVFSARTNKFGQWIFLKHWVTSGGSFEMRVLCSVPKRLRQADRFIMCDAEAQQKGRKIEGVYKHVVHCQEVNL
jgi:hypothetical protein